MREVERKLSSIEIIIIFGFNIFLIFYFNDWLNIRLDDVFVVQQEYSVFVKALCMLVAFGYAAYSTITGVFQRKVLDNGEWVKQGLIGKLLYFILWFGLIYFVLYFIFISFIPSLYTNYFGEHAVLYEFVEKEERAKSSGDECDYVLKLREGLNDKLQQCIDKGLYDSLSKTLINAELRVKQSGLGYIVLDVYLPDFVEKDLGQNNT